MWAKLVLFTRLNSAVLSQRIGARVRRNTSFLPGDVEMILRILDIDTVPIQNGIINTWIYRMRATCWHYKQKLSMAVNSNKSTTYSYYMQKSIWNRHKVTERSHRHSLCCRQSMVQWCVKNETSLNIKMTWDWWWWLMTVLILISSPFLRYVSLLISHFLILLFISIFIESV